MPQYLSPGVYVEEVSFRTGTIEGVSTSTAAFVGPTRFGPISGTPTLLTCLSDFEAIYGSIDPMYFVDAGSMVNYVAQSVRAFFDNGGGSLYISRAWNPGPDSPSTFGYAQATLNSAASPPQVLSWSGRYPGSEGNVTLTITFSIGQDVLGGTSASPALRSVNAYDLVWISPVASPPNPPGTGGAFYWAESYLNKATGGPGWRFHDVNDNVTDLSTLDPAAEEVRIFTANLQITYPDGTQRSDFYPGLSFDPRSTNSFSQTFAAQLNNSYYELTRPIVFSYSDASDAAGIEIAELMLAQAAPVNGVVVTIPAMIARTVTQAQYTEVLTDGLDGYRPLEPQYQGTEDPLNPLIKTGLVALEDLTNVSIVAAPGSTYLADSTYIDGLQITNDLIAHCENMLYRIAVLDSPDSEAVSQVSAWRGQIDSSYAALYYPWIRILDPVTDLEINLPPSGFVAGIYARSDNNEGVQKAPANEVVTDAIGFEVLLNKGQQDLLNPQGINCFRFFDGRGYRLWGARTVTSDAEWQYVNLRRYMNYLKQSIDEGTQSLVFESNGPDLWASTTQLVTDFLNNEFANGRLLGTTPAQAFFVRCDLTTMTQNDLDNGRLVCLIGVSLLRPAEFVIFRIGQFTASSSQS
ncbi:MAG TPA: phage tail sheath subtilisin-like domain-containing protein [Terracidiphilus sp.]